jgi:BirA family biotin operon repressor/biotin-[acetyl-CoA-carboxylase] ligase
MSTADKLDRLIADQLKSQLAGTGLIGRNIVVLEETGSTNDAILRLACLQREAASGSSTLNNQGLVVFAEHQTAGRGQRGNRWDSAQGKGLWFSILLCPEIQLSDSGRLTVWAIETVADMIRVEFGLEPAIKLPNDIQLYEHKVGGVLVEMRAQEKAPHLAVVGIGINVNQCRVDFPRELQSSAISLAMALGRQVDRQKFAVALLRKLDSTYRDTFLPEGADLGSRISHATQPRLGPAATTSPAPTTNPDIPAAKFPMA